MDAGTRRRVRERAAERCEYCRLHQKHAELLHHVEHVIAKQHGGLDGADNLALACQRCNLRKGPNLTGIDPLTGEVSPLFHPRRGRWADHFIFRNAFIEGLSAAGRATILVLAMNDARRLDLRGRFCLLANSSEAERLDFLPAMTVCRGHAGARDRDRSGSA